MAPLLRRILMLSETLLPDHQVLAAKDGNVFIWERISGKTTRRFPELLLKIRCFNSIAIKKI